MGKNDKELDGFLCTVKKFSDDIGMEFGLDKCVKATLIRGRLTSNRMKILALGNKTKKKHINI